MLYVILHDDMIRTQVYIPDELHKESKLYAELLNKSISEFMREGLSMSIEKIKRERVNPLGCMVGRFQAKGDKDAALNHNDIYDLH